MKQKKNLIEIYVFWTRPVKTLNESQVSDRLKYSSIRFTYMYNLPVQNQKFLNSDCLIIKMSSAMLLGVLPITTDM